MTSSVQKVKIDDFYFIFIIIIFYWTLFALILSSVILRGQWRLIAPHLPVLQVVESDWSCDPASHLHSRPSPVGMQMSSQPPFRIWHVPGGFFLYKIKYEYLLGTNKQITKETIKRLTKQLQKALLKLIYRNY